MRAVAAVAAVLWSGLGCAPRQTEFEIVDHRADGPPETYYEAFPECYYSTDARGRVDVVARRETPAPDGNGFPLVQVVHLRQTWPAVPGETPAHESMINATVSYYVVAPGGGASFDGGGFVTFTENRAESQIRGRLESADLVPQRRVGADADLFRRAAVTGTFRAARDKGEVLRIVHEMQRLFGPPPRYKPPPVRRDLR